ncbi:MULTISPECIES: GNAT family N-acetyltransferase [Pseudomonas syringae group]|uniref:N-acetyltransferase n=3 Tax=Pseudomonas syringae group TaxID=136849 RepID=A0AAD0GR94_9PSED|nr:MULTISPECIES: GNAT family N-acetyltransferase [Pseudomonas syringae group]AVB20151.1 N-acetyltransferase [Pseudomonas avellanae]EGH09558.1 GNAT family acetyltransferase [Pseudomonas amygdali pv. morsprunorum str. M302280]EKG31691.1 GNAT family acetyltransferase [Pseudomonas avellanae BPIC 631]KWS56995.1 acetyltransferase [Pseudomonas amygdali pv. morsprunorum]PHN45352.1 acetyltransferase [Pseudomonas avellanae]
MDCVIRNAVSTDATAISALVVTTLRESNAQDYSPDIIRQVQQSFSPSAILHFLTCRQVYVASVDDDVVATASLDQDTVRSVFVDPAHQGKGIGRQLMTTLEAVAARNGVKQLRVPSSITAEGFYLSLGFQNVRDEFHGAERTIIMEKALRG